MSEIVELARKMYDDCPTPKPSWEQLGDVTKGVWIEKAQERLNGNDKASAEPDRG